MEESIKDIFSNVNEWLKFAEAKNAALIVLNLGSIFGAATIITQSNHEIPQLILYYLYLFISLNSLGLSIALFSFWPQTQKLFNAQLDTKNGSVLYYGYIKDYKSPDLYLAKLCEFCNKEQKEFSSLESDYASQIIINSSIASRKINYFKIALFCTLSAIVTPILSILFAFLFMYEKCVLKE